MYVLGGRSVSASRQRKNAKVTSAILADVKRQSCAREYLKERYVRQEALRYWAPLLLQEFPNSILEMEVKSWEAIEYNRSPFGAQITSENILKETGMLATAEDQERWQELTQKLFKKIERLRVKENYKALLQEKSGANG